MRFKDTKTLLQRVAFFVAGWNWGARVVKYFAMNKQLVDAMGRFEENLDTAESLLAKIWDDLIPFVDDTCLVNGALDKKQIDALPMAQRLSTNADRLDTICCMLRNLSESLEL